MICYYFPFQRLLKSSKSKRLEKQIIDVKGPLRSINQWIDMSNRNVTLQNGTQVKTCSPALGMDFFMDFLGHDYNLKNSSQDLSNEGSNFILNSLEVGY